MAVGVAAGEVIIALTIGGGPQVPLRMPWNGAVEFAANLALAAVEAEAMQSAAKKLRKQVTQKRLDRSE